jgi:hypothetical protein
MKDETAKNIYGFSILLLEELEKTEGTSTFKQKFKFHAKALISEIEKFDRDIYSHAGGEEMFDFVNELRNKLEVQ